MDLKYFPKNERIQNNFLSQDIASLMDSKAIEEYFVPYAIFRETLTTTFNKYHATLGRRK